MSVLKRDWIGSQFADFERALLFDRDKEHWGWLEWSEKGNNRIFALSKSPFLGRIGDPVYYILPENFGILPPEGQFIRVEVSGPPHIERYPERYVSYEVKNIRPVSDKDLFEILPRPRSSLDDFKYQATINFKNARQDNLDIVLPLQIVSCPSNESGYGGLTVERATFLSGKKDMRAIKNFKNGILEQIPSGFREVNPAYIYRAVSGRKEEKAIEGLFKRVNEVNVLTDTGTSLKVNIPVIHLQSRYHHVQDLSSDVVSYQLSALICRPFVRSSDIKLIENSIKKARRRMDDASVDFNLMPNSAVKIAESMARLRLIQNNAIYRFLGEATGLLESQLKVQEDLFNDIWHSQVDAFADLKDLYDGIELKNVRVGKKKASVKLGYFNSELSRRDVSVYLEIRKMAQGSGNMNVLWPDLKARMGMDDARLSESLDILRNFGYIIMLDNRSVIRVLDLGEFSDTFDTALPK